MGFFEWVGGAYNYVASIYKGAVDTGYKAASSGYSTVANAGGTVVQNAGSVYDSGSRAVGQTINVARVAAQQQSIRFVSGASQFVSGGIRTISRDVSPVIQQTIRSAPTISIGTMVPPMGIAMMTARVVSQSPAIQQRAVQLARQGIDAVRTPAAAQAAIYAPPLGVAAFAVRAVAERIQAAQAPREAEPARITAGGADWNRPTTLVPDATATQSAPNQYAQQAITEAQARPGYYPPSSLGDRTTQEAMRAVAVANMAFRQMGMPEMNPDVAAGGIIETQRVQARATPGVQDDQFFLNELQKWAQSRVEVASAYHAIGMRGDVPIPENPFEMQADLAVEMLKGVPRKDSERFSPMSGAMAPYLPGGRGLQDIAWDTAITQKVPDVSFMSAVAVVGGSRGGLFTETMGAPARMATVVTPQLRTTANAPMKYPDVGPVEFLPKGVAAQGSQQVTVRPSELQLMLQPKSEASLEGFVVRFGEAAASVPFVGDIVKGAGALAYGGRDIFTSTKEIATTGPEVIGVSTTTVGQSWQEVTELGAGAYAITTFTPSITETNKYTTRTTTVSPMESPWEAMEKKYAPAISGWMPEWKSRGGAASGAQMKGASAEAVIGGMYTGIREKPMTAAVFAAGGALMVFGAEAVAGLGAGTVAATRAAGMTRTAFTMEKAVVPFVTSWGPKVLGGLYTADIAMTGFKPSTRSGSIVDTDWTLNPTQESFRAMGSRLSTEAIPMLIGGGAAAYRGKFLSDTTAIQNSAKSEGIITRISKSYEFLKQDYTSFIQKNTIHAAQVPIETAFPSVKPGYTRIGHVTTIRSPEMLKSFESQGLSMGTERGFKMSLEMTSVDLTGQGQMFPSAPSASRSNWYQAARETYLEGKAGRNMFGKYERFGEDILFFDIKPDLYSMQKGILSTGKGSYVGKVTRAELSAGFIETPGSAPTISDYIRYKGKNVAAYRKQIIPSLKQTGETARGVAGGAQTRISKAFSEKPATMLETVKIRDIIIEENPLAMSGQAARIKETTTETLYMRSGWKPRFMEPTATGRPSVTTRVATVDLPSYARDIIVKGDVPKFGNLYARESEVTRAFVTPQRNIVIDTTATSPLVRTGRMKPGEIATPAFMETGGIAEYPRIETRSLVTGERVTYGGFYEELVTEPMSVMKRYSTKVSAAGYIEEGVTMRTVFDKGYTIEQQGLGAGEVRIRKIGNIADYVLGVESETITPRIGQSGMKITSEKVMRQFTTDVDAGGKSGYEVDIGTLKLTKLVEHPKQPPYLEKGFDILEETGGVRASSRINELLGSKMGKRGIEAGEYQTDIQGVMDRLAIAHDLSARISTKPEVKSPLKSRPGSPAALPDWLRTPMSETFSKTSGSAVQQRAYEAAIAERTASIPWNQMPKGSGTLKMADPTESLSARVYIPALEAKGVAIRGGIEYPSAPSPTSKPAFVLIEEDAYTSPRAQEMIEKATGTKKPAAMQERVELQGQSSLVRRLMSHWQSGSQVQEQVSELASRSLSLSGVRMASDVISRQGLKQWADQARATDLRTAVFRETIPEWKRDVVTERTTVTAQRTAQDQITRQYTDRYTYYDWRVVVTPTVIIGPPFGFGLPGGGGDSGWNRIPGYRSDKYANPVGADLLIESAGKPIPQFRVPAKRKRMPAMKKMKLPRW